MGTKRMWLRAAGAFVVVVAALALPAFARAGTIVIDDFHTNQSCSLGTSDQKLMLCTAVYPPETGSGSLVVPPAEASSGIIGGERDVYEYDVQRYVDDGGFGYRSQDASFAWAQGNEFMFDRQIGVKASLLIAWDGNDGGAPGIDYTGLGGVDLTAGGIDRFRFDLGVNSGARALTVTVYTDATHYSTADVPLPFNRGTVDETFSSFTTGAGAAGPADFSNVGAITAGVAGAGDGGGPDLWSITAVAPPDSTPPTITASAKTADGSVYTPNTWTRQNVIVSFQCSDASGVASVTQPVTVSASGHDQAVTGTCVDNSGNRATATFYGIDVDNTGPVVTDVLTAGGAAYQPGTWTNKDVTVTWTCTDELNPSATQPAPTVVSSEGANQQASVTCSDALGNTSTRTVYGLDVDKTPPTATAGALDFSTGTTYEPGTWTKGPVDVYFDCQDDLSGAPTIPNDVFVTQSGEDQTATATCTDLAGNVATASFAQIDVDQTGPVLTASATSGGAPYTAGTWTNQPVAVSFSCTDADSGVASESPAGVTVAGDGAGQSAAATCTDKVGNTTTATFGPIDVDRTPPTVTATATTADGAAYTPGTWTTQAVTVAFSCSDAGSGVATVSPARTFAADASDASATGTCTDAAGNTATAILDHVDVDLTPPTIVAHASPAANAAGWNNGPVTVTFSCSDGQGSGVATCPAPVTLSGEGTGQSASGTATDAVGHSATATVDGIDIDTTAPTVTWGDHPASYLPTDTVTISCSASDALSGIAASTCADVSAPASSFGFGTTTLTATVTDAAGNKTTARTSFAVSVTFAGLCSLTRQYVTSRVAANVACGTLTVAARLAQRDRTRRAAAALVGAYVTEVRIDERLRLVSQANAALLIELAGSLT